MIKRKQRSESVSNYLALSCKVNEAIWNTIWTFEECYVHQINFSLNAQQLEAFTFWNEKCNNKKEAKWLWQLLALNDYNDSKIVLYQIHFGVGQIGYLLVVVNFPSDS